MLERMNEMREKIQAKLLDKKYTTLLEQRTETKNLVTFFDQALTDVINIPNPAYWTEDPRPELVEYFCFSYYLKLLAIACTFDMQEELKVLLSAEILFKNSLESKSLIDRPLTTCRGNGSDNTMLGIAALNGHLDLAKGLVELKADVNTVGLDRQAPLHMTVLGDSAPIHHSSLGTQHADVAQYLIEHKADLSAKNKSRRTPLEEAQRAAPFSTLSSFIYGENPVRKTYCADAVRPVLEKAQPVVEKGQKEETGSTAGMLSSLMSSLSLSNPLAVKAAEEDKLDVQSSVSKQMENDEAETESNDEFVLVDQSGEDVESNSPPPVTSETDKDAADTEAPDSPTLNLDANLAVASLRRRRE